MKAEGITSRFIAHHIIETKVHVVGEVRKNSCQILPECLGNLDVGFEAQFGRYLRRKVGNHTEFVIDVVFGFAIAVILIHETAASNGCRPENKVYQVFYEPRHQSD